MPPETFTGVVRPLLSQSLQALGPPRGEVAVGDEGTVAGDAELAAVGVAGEQQVRAVLGEMVQHALVRGVDDGHAEVRVPVLAPGAAGPAGVPFPAQVRIVHAGEVEADALAAPPTGGGWSGPPSRPCRTRSAAAASPVRLVSRLALDGPQQIGRGVLEAGAEVVVGPGDKHAGKFQQRAQRLQQGVHGLGVAEVVAGVDHQVRLQLGQGLQATPPWCPGRGRSGCRSGAGPGTGPGPAGRMGRVSSRRTNWFFSHSPYPKAARPAAVPAAAVTAKPRPMFRTRLANAGLTAIGQLVLLLAVAGGWCPVGRLRLHGCRCAGADTVAVRMSGGVLVWACRSPCWSAGPGTGSVP